MANSNITKLSTLPWPTLVGASVLLHAGILAMGLPQILPVENPGDSSVHIPVTLVEDEAAPVAAAPANIPQSAPPPPETQSVNGDGPTSPVTESVPIGGQTSAVNVGEQAATSQTPSTPQPDSRRPDPPEETIPNPERVSPPAQEPTLEVEAQVPEQNSPSQEPSAVAPQPMEGTGGSSQTSPTLVTIRDVNIPEQLNIRDDPEPNFQRGVSLTIPASSSCEGGVPANTPIDVLVEIRGGDGQIATLPGSLPPEVEQTANCLLMSAIDVDPSRISFKPATPNSGEYDFAQEGSISAIGRLTLVFE